MNNSSLGWHKKREKNLTKIEMINKDNKDSEEEHQWTLMKGFKELPQKLFSKSWIGLNRKINQKLTQYD